MEILLSVLRVLLEEQSEKSIDVFAGSHSIADGASAIREAGIDGLVQKDNRSVIIPRVWIVNYVAVLINRRWPKLKEKTGERRAPRTTVDPEDHRIVLRIVARLKEP